MPGAQLPYRCREPRPPRLRREVGEHRGGADPFRGPRVGRLRRRNARALARAARDPHLRRRGSHRGADGVTRSPLPSGRGRGRACFWPENGRGYRPSPNPSRKREGLLKKPLSYIIRLCQPSSGSFKSCTNTGAVRCPGGLVRFFPAPKPDRERAAHKAELS